MCSFWKYDVLKSNSDSCFLVDQKVDFDKNETESKMENSTYAFWEKKLIVQLIWESRIKNKTNELELAKEKRGHFYERSFCPKVFFFSVCILSPCIEYWMNFLSETLLGTLFCFFLKLSKAFSVFVSINNTNQLRFNDLYKKNIKNRKRMNDIDFMYERGSALSYN